MFKVEVKNAIGRVLSGLSIVLLFLLLGACTHLSPTVVGESKSWVVENLKSKTTAELYAKMIAPGVFERSGSKVIDGYTVESGNLLMPDKSTGSLVTVRSTDGSLTAVIEEPGNNGLLVINNRGEARFVSYPHQDYSLLDTVKEKMDSVQSKSQVTAGPYVIDMLIGYSRSAVEAAGGDAYANALAQVESVNLALRNSNVTDVSMRLIGVQVVEQNFPITTDTLDRLGSIFSVGMNQFNPDMLYGVFSGHPDDTAGGWAYVRNRFAIGWVYGEAFRHEVGHNAGGLHCFKDGGSLVIYAYGYDNGKTTTAMCGNENPYYSTHLVKDAHGLPVGNILTANMARVWRDNAARLSSYAPSFAGEKISLVSIGEYTSTFLDLTVPRGLEAGFVAVSSTQGPTQLSSNPPGGFTRLTVKLKGSDGIERNVYLRGMRVKGDCLRTAMNAYDLCHHPLDTMGLELAYYPEDNNTLPKTMHNGELVLQARDRAGSWVTPIKVLISVRG